MNGIKNLMVHKTSPEIVLLDDAFQHRKVKAGFNIMLTTFEKPYFSDIVLPTGDLREPRKGAKRADIIVVTKCPKGLLNSDKDSFLNQIKPNKNQHVFFSSISYSDTVFTMESKRSLSELNDFTLVTGIANANPLVEFLKVSKLEFEHLNFKDHHEFSIQDIEALNQKELILTTEKDFMRLKQYTELKDKLFYLPIQVKMDNQETFNKLVLNYVKNNN
jgi:tetraacyldisaccharide 4'-kinase